jgi:hypothetical protein
MQDDNTPNDNKYSKWDVEQLIISLNPEESDNDVLQDTIMDAMIETFPYASVFFTFYGNAPAKVQVKYFLAPTDKVVELVDDLTNQMREFAEEINAAEESQDTNDDDEGVEP